MMLGVRLILLGSLAFTEYAPVVSACPSLGACYITEAGSLDSNSNDLQVVDLMTYSVVPDDDYGLTVVCDTTDGEVDQFHFTFGDNNNSTTTITHTERQVPYYGNGNSLNWAPPVESLTTCGRGKTLTVAGELDNTLCFETVFEYTTDCTIWPNENSTLLYNGNFERFNSGWSEFEPVRESGDSFTGMGAVKVEPGGVATQTVRVVPGGDYTLTAALKLEGLDAGNRAGVYVGGNAANMYLLDFPNETDSYEIFNVSFNVGDNTNVTVFVAGGDVRADDIVLSGPFPSTYTDVEAIFDWDIWTLEGGLPFTGDAGVWVFDALEEFVITPNGNGARHENKVDSDFRFPLTVQYEEFSADITPILSPFAETIVVQWHPVGLSILLAVYVTDMSSESPILYNLETGEQWLELENGIGGDGIFDIVVISRSPGASELFLAGGNITQSFGSVFQQEGFTAGTVESGETFSIRSVNDHGIFDVKLVVGGETIQFTLEADESTNSYLKYGSYLQAKDPFTAERALSDEDKILLSTEEKGQVFQDFYDEYNITEGTVLFENIHYSRVIDPEALAAAANDDDA